MNKKYLILIVLIIVFLRCETKREQTNEIRLGSWDYAWMQKVKKELDESGGKYLPAYNQLIKDANDALNEGIFSVTFKKFMPPSGNKHDYMSMGPYWWPDPEKENGLPYIGRDGEINPERNELDSPRKEKMVNNVRNLSLAWFFSGEQKYAEKAAELLRVWFLNEETLMNPHLEYAQAIPGRTPGRFIGVIDGKCFETLVDAIVLLETSGALTCGEKEGLRNWFERYFRWLRESEHGKSEDSWKNNHSVAYDLQSTGIAYFLGDDDFVACKVREMPRRRIDPMIEADGRQPEELIRTKSFGYSVGNLSNFIRVGEKGLKTGVNIFGYTNQKGGSIQKALDFLVAYIGRKKDWPYQQITSWEHTENDLGLIIRSAALIYKNEEYQKLWEDNFAERLKAHWKLLVSPEYKTD